MDSEVGEEEDVGDGGRLVPSSFRESMRWMAFSWSVFRLVVVEVMVSVCYLLLLDVVSIMCQKSFYVWSNCQDCMNVPIVSDLCRQ